MKILNKKNLIHSLFLTENGNFIPQSDISYKYFGKQGLETIKNIESNVGYIVWGTAFNNVHVRIPFKEETIIVDNIQYHSVEHYYQAMKSYGTSDHGTVLKEMSSELSPRKAWSIGQKFKIRKNWDDIRKSIMERGVKEKFSHPRLINLLLQTGDTLLMPVKFDKYWGSGLNGKGKNILGKILMDLRKELQIYHF
ncbi:MAG: NADAR family protein [Candidatus Hodarchaeales archaeon]